MSDAEVRAWCAEHFDAKCRAFGLGHWKLRLDFVRGDLAEDGFKTAARCKTRYEYEHAVIELDTDEFRDLAELERTVEHELMHVIHSPFTALWDFAMKVMSDDAQQAFGLMYHHAQEQTLCNMERMAKSLRTPPESTLK